MLFRYREAIWMLFTLYFLLISIATAGITSHKDLFFNAGAIVMGVGYTILLVRVFLDKRKRKKSYTALKDELEKSDSNLRKCMYCDWIGPKEDFGYSHSGKPICKHCIK